MFQVGNVFNILAYEITIRMDKKKNKSQDINMEKTQVVFF